jgi:hypothetical protein
LVDSLRTRLRPFLLPALFIGLSCLIRGIYVFRFTDYHHYLVSDMGGYWTRALQWIHGERQVGNQWAIWPPLYHIVLANAFLVFRSVGITAPHWLAAFLLVQIILGSISVYFIYGIARVILRNQTAAIVAGVLYMLAYPVIYLNAYLLSENVAMPLVIAAAFLVVHYPRRASRLLLAGALMAIAAGIRPAYLSFSLAFVVFALASQGGVRKAWRGLAFGAGFAVVMLGICANMSWMSHGRIRGPSANGGINFFIAQCKVLHVENHFIVDGAEYTYVIIAPQFAEEQWRGYHYSERPPYDQGYFIKEGTKCLCEEGMWLDNFVELRKLYFGTFFPTMSTAAGCMVLDPIDKVLFGVLTLAALLLAPVSWLVRRRINKPAALLWSFILLVSITSYFFGSERRYIYSVTFAVFPVLLSLFLPRKASQLNENEG